jgi:hypothetical protein
MFRLWRHHRTLRIDGAAHGNVSSSTEPNGSYESATTIAGGERAA